MQVSDVNQNTSNTAIICPIVKTRNSAWQDGDVLLNEAEGLVLAMGQTVVWKQAVKLNKIIPSSFFGKGNLEKIKQYCQDYQVDLVVIDETISAVQQRNLEKFWQVKVIDRTAVILEIFGGRAHTKEGKLQVELAHLTYQRGRLVRSWTHLERQRGGGGFMGGPGETQIELDRRHIDERIVKIKKDLDKVKQTRQLHRVNRVKVPFPVVALVGYTNAGKSSLFNFITKEKVFAEDMLFATLDPTMRKIEPAKGVNLILSDTVGFISNLPHELVMAFRATLEEVLEADVILHVIDAANPLAKKQKDDVLTVLHELGLEKIETDSNYIEVFNKIDLLDEVERKARIKRNSAKCVAVSAVTGEGTDALLKVIADKFIQKQKVETCKIKITDGKKLAEIYETAEVLSRREDEQFIYLKVRKII